MVSNVDDAIIFLKKHLRISYRIKTLQRENILELPEDALREAIVNAVCHRDYFEKGARVMVEMFDDRVDIVSPGGLCKGVTPENFGKVSISRNPGIASMLYRIRYIEQMGTGILRMKLAAREAEVAEPEFEYSGFFTATFKRQATVNGDGFDIPAIETGQQLENTDRTPENTDRIIENTDRTSENTDRISENTDRTSENTDRNTDRESRVINYITEHSAITNSEACALLHLKDSSVKKIFASMTAQKLILPVGDRKQRKYILPD